MMFIVKILKKPYFWLGLIILVGLFVRLYKIDNPIADWHSWRQADTAAVVRNFYQEGFNPLYPKYDDLSDVSVSGLQNPNGYRFVEFPIYNFLVYLAYLVNGGVDEKLARLVSIIMSLGSAVFLFFIVKKYWDTVTALLSSAIFVLLPFNIYFSRVILPEPSQVFFSLGMFIFTLYWIEERRWFLLSVIFTMAAMLVKPTSVFYLLPLIYVFLQKEKKLWPIPGRYWVWGLASFSPFILWRLWISQYPEGIPASSWLLNGDGIRFKPIFWKWILGERLGKEILSIAGTILLFLGLLIRQRGSSVLHFLAASMFLYLIVFATGNVRHDYYQTLIIPVLSVFVARGFVILIKGTENLIPRLWTIPLAVLMLFLTFYLGWGEVKGLYQVNNAVILEAGAYANKVLPQNAKVIAPYNGDTAFLYQINRPGWPFVPFAVKDMVKDMGATHYVSVSYDAKTAWLAKRYEAITANPKFVILDLTKLNPQYLKDAEAEPAQ